MSSLAPIRLTPTQYRAFAALDRNHDGVLTMADAAGKNDTYRADMLQFLIKADRNQDFAADRVEFFHAFQAADQDGNGRVNDTETRQYLDTP